MPRRDLVVIGASAGGVNALIDALGDGKPIDAAVLVVLHLSPAGRTSLPEIRAFYTETAALINTTPENVAFAGSATHAFATALSAIPFEAGDVILPTRNDFNGGDLGFATEWRRGRWSMETLLKLGIGNTHSEVAINGATSVTTNGASTVANGGLLALPPPWTGSART